MRVRISKLGWAVVVMAGVAAAFVGCKTPLTAILTATASAPETAAQHQQEGSSQNRYVSTRAGFQFDYPAGFVAEATPPSGEGDNRVIEWIDLWSQQDYDSMQSRVTPTEFPANVSISVQQNLQRLTLQDWVQQSNQFALPERFTSLTVAGQRAIAFQSTGLYEYEHVVFAHPNGSDVMMIRLDKDGLPERDAVYRPVFQHVISSVQFLAR